MPGAKNVSALIDECRCSLTQEEIGRYRWLGKNTSECLKLASMEIEPGMSEYEIGSLQNSHLLSRGIMPVLTLIAVDDRISKYRHPIATDKKLERYAILITGARKWGLILSATRIVHFGGVPSELKRKHEAVARVDATFIANTRPGARMGDVFLRAMEAYKSTGFRDEWMLHHQGGPTGYKAREFRVTSQTDAVVAENQAFAWNPSITGTKSEDTIIALPSGSDIISQDDDWPMIEIDIDGVIVKRPDILIR